MIDAVEIAAKAMAEAMNGGTWEDQKWYSEQHKDRWTEAMRAALTAVLDAVTLEWERETDAKHYADTPLGRYDVEFWAAYGWTCHSPLMRSVAKDSREAAQAAALADYRARLARAPGMEEG